MPSIHVPNLQQVLSRGADANGTVLTNLGSPSSSTDAATKAYVDSTVASVSVAHNSTTSKQGGTSGEYYHLTSAEYTGTGTGVFSRKDSPVFTGTSGFDIIELSGDIKMASGSSINWNSGSCILSNSGTALVSSGDLTLGTVAGSGTKALYAGGISVMSNGRVTVNNTNQSTTLTDFTQSIANAGLLINTSYTANAYTAGLFWATTNDNASVPKAGIWMKETGAGTLLYLGTSNNYAAGVTSSISIDQNGSIGAQSMSLNTACVLGSTGGTTGYIYLNGSTSGNVVLSVADAAGTWTMKLPTTAGTSGYFLQTDGSGNTTWASASGSAPTVYPKYFPANASSNYIWYSDDTDMMAICESTQTQICISNACAVDSTTAGTSQNMRYLSGTAQTVAISTIWAAADNVTGLIIQGGYVYVSLYDSGGSNRIYRCATSADITAGGNWTQLTISGTALQNSASAGLVGYGNGTFWVIDTTNGYIPYTLSGTTLTSGAAVTVTGATYTSYVCRANTTGFYVYFGSAPYIRFASFAGTLDGTKQVSTPNNWCFVFDGAAYTKTGSNWSKLNF